MQKNAVLTCSVEFELIQSFETPMEEDTISYCRFQPRGKKGMGVVRSDSSRRRQILWMADG